MSFDFQTKTVILTAGGIGKRMGGAQPKQFLLLAGEPLLFHTIRRFHAYDPGMQLIVSLPADWISHWEDLCAAHHFAIAHETVEGGKERFHSIQNALSKALGQLIAVHDGVRPFPSRETLKRCFETAAREGSAVPVTELKESLREVSPEGSVALIRSRYRAVQTPQVFREDILRRAYLQEFHDGITDDASLVEALGVRIALVTGNDENIKVTNPTDLLLAEAILGSGAEF